MLFILWLTCTASSPGHLNITWHAQNAPAAKNGARQVEIGSTGGREDGEYNVCDTGRAVSL